MPYVYTTNKNVAGAFGDKNPSFDGKWYVVKITNPEYIKVAENMAKQDPNDPDFKYRAY